MPEENPKPEKQKSAAIKDWLLVIFGIAALIPAVYYILYHVLLPLGVMFFLHIVVKTYL